VKAVLFAKDKGKITNSDYQTLNDISKRTATTELTELADKFKVLTKTGTSGAGIYYNIVGQ
jgi:ATP-dependent DNA helicase RecG